MFILAFPSLGKPLPSLGFGLLMHKVGLIQPEMISGSHPLAAPLNFLKDFAKKKKKKKCPDA